MNKHDFVEKTGGMAFASARMALLCCIFLHIFSSVATLTATPISRSVDKTLQADGTVAWKT